MRYDYTGRFQAEGRVQCKTCGLGMLGVDENWPDSGSFCICHDKQKPEPQAPEDKLPGESYDDYYWRTKGWTPDRNADEPDFRNDQILRSNMREAPAESAPLVYEKLNRDQLIERLERYEAATFPEMKSAYDKLAAELAEAKRDSLFKLCQRQQAKLTLCEQERDIYKAALEYINNRAWCVEPKANAWKWVNDFCEVAKTALQKGGGE